MASRLSLYKPMRVVHPGVVAAKLPSSDQLQLTIRVAVLEGGQGRITGALIRETVIHDDPATPWDPRPKS
jgi:hypothetical protein